MNLSEHEQNELLIEQDLTLMMLEQDLVKSVFEAPDKRLQQIYGDNELLKIIRYIKKYFILVPKYCNKEE